MWIHWCLVRLTLKLTTLKEILFTEFLFKIQSVHKHREQTGDCHKGVGWQDGWNRWRGKISDTVWCLDLNNGYVSVCTCQNLSTCTLRYVHSIVYISIKKTLEKKEYSLSYWWKDEWWLEKIFHSLPLLEFSPSVMSMTAIIFFNDFLCMYTKFFFQLKGWFLCNKALLCSLFSYRDFMIIV